MVSNVLFQTKLLVILLRRSLPLLRFHCSVDVIPLQVTSSDPAASIASTPRLMSSLSVAFSMSIVYMPEQDLLQGHDLDLWPMTLTFELDLDMLRADPHAKIQVCMSVHSAGIVRRTDTQTHTHTHTHTHDVKTITPSADAGCNKDFAEKINGPILHLEKYFPVASLVSALQR